MPRSDVSASAVTASAASATASGAWEHDEFVALSPDRRAEMQRMMEAAEHEVVESMIGEQSSLATWKPSMRKKGIAYYVDENVAKGMTRFCCVGHTDAPVEEIMKMFMVADTDTLMKNVRVIYRNVKEAKILAVLKPPTRQRPMQSMYVRYSSFETPKLMSGRDLLVCVCTNLLRLEDGSTVGYCLFESVELPECPERYESERIIRSKISRSGFFIRNSGKPSALTKVCYINGLSIGGIAPQLAGKVYMTVFGGNCARLCSHYRKRSLNPETFVPRARYKSRRAAKSCTVCTRHFGALSKRINCVSCGDVVCRRCCFTEEVSVRGAVVTPVKICSYCLHNAGMLRSNVKAIAGRDSVDTIGSDESGIRDLLRRNSSSGRHA